MSMTRPLPTRTRRWSRRSAYWSTRSRQFAQQTPPSEPDASFLRTVDGLSDTIDRLVHTELGGDAHSWPWHFGADDFVFDHESPWRFGFDTQPVPEPDRDLLHSADA